MKLLFIVFYTVIQTLPRPCPDKNLFTTCGVYHGTYQDTSRVEHLTTDPATVKRLRGYYPDATVDTFYLMPFTLKTMETK